MPIYDLAPRISKSAWIAPDASVIGRVDMGDSSVVWYGAVLRGDLNNIKVGKSTNIGDRTIVHVSSGGPEGPLPTHIGDNVLVEHGTILHACKIEDGAKIEPGSTVLDGAVVGKGSVITAGSLVTAGKQIPAGEVWGGVPAKFIRKVTEEDTKAIASATAKLLELASKHNAELSKSPEDVDTEKLLTEEMDKSKHKQKQIVPFNTSR